jgi:hypothetical protein
MEIKMDQIQKNVNPLTAFFRQPKIYINLPSQGKFYPEGSLTKSDNGEYPVYAMTAKDELLFKTPDALLNGSATVDVIKSCIPAIADPWKMPSIDLDAVLIAIRLATYGSEMDVTTTCPSCNEEEDKAADLRQLLDNLRDLQFEDKIEIGSEMTVYIKPMAYSEISKASIKTMEQQRIFSIVNDESIPEAEKIKMFQVSFVKLTEITIEVVAECISKIETSQGATDNPEFIKEFLANTDRVVFDRINEHVKSMQVKSKMKALDTTCSSCGHAYKLEISFDQSDFFADGS